MTEAGDEIPVVLFAYARPGLVQRTLEALRANRVPRIIAFCDGAKGERDAAAVAQVRAQLRAVDWTRVEMVERASNFGLGKSVLAGVTEVARHHEAFVVFEDDLICCPGTYAWMAAALRHYRDDPRVWSVTGWTHPRVKPASSGLHPYFDARAESWTWGAYARSWAGMDEPALAKLAAVERKGIAADICGTDLPAMAAVESDHNLWAVRWLYQHLQHGGLCLRPPVALVEHAGVDEAATNPDTDDLWAGAVVADRAPAEDDWPEPVESVECRDLWTKASPAPPGIVRRAWRRAREFLGGKSAS
jgi:hypothetical protein